MLLMNKGLKGEERGRDKRTRGGREEAHKESDEGGKKVRRKGGTS